MARWRREALLLPALSVVPVPEYLPILRLHLPLIEPDVRISRIRLSDKAVHAVAHEARQGGASPQPQQAQRRVQILVRVA